ncbi:MAG TPA: hypothetical protein VJL90_03585 [Pseudorhodoplanes sp.]|nr:hypothetical protein [Pseudorhodoplanes sp.]
MARKATRRVLQVLADMPDPDFAALIESLPARGGTITMKELAKAATPMSPPRRPRGEKPATTIRLQRQQIRNMANIIAELRDRLAKSEKAEVDAGVKAIESQREVDRTNQTVFNQSVRIGELLDQNRADALRLAFLEGYYAKSTEANPGTIARNPGSLPPSEQDHEGEGIQASP